MKTKNYKKLCRYCDNILLSNKSTIFTHSITSLHILKEHPVLLDNYFENINYHNRDKSNLNLKILSFLKNLILETKNFKLSDYQKSGCDILIISHLINSKHLNNSNDFYFGDLEKRLNKKNIRTFSVYRNFTNKSYKELYPKLSKNKILLSKITNFFNEIFFFKKLISEYFFIKKHYQIPRIKNLKSNFLSLLSFRTIVSNLRLSYQIKSLVKILKPKLILITFEGHAWERVLIKTIKGMRLNIKLGAYQFTSTTKYQHSIFRKLKKEYNPDLVLTSGEITKKKFVKKFNSKVIISGSSKSKKIKNKFKNIKENIFLFLPEGFYSETKILYDFAELCAKKYPNFKFVFKCHPMMGKFFDNKKKINNLIITKKNLIYELNRSKFVVYRGSASVYEAILNGCIPLYLSQKNELSINPLHDVLPNNHIIRDIQNLNKIIKNNKKLNPKLLKYCKSFFMPLDDRSIVDYYKKIY